MKRNSFSILAALVAFFALVGCQPSAQKQQLSGKSETTVSTIEETTDSVAEPSAPGVLTLAKALELVEPGQKLEPSAIEQYFASLQLPLQYSEQYISDADWGGDSPAISYCFGNQVKYDNFKFIATGDEYYGVHTNFFYDQSRQTGSVNRFAVITSDSLWHVRLMEDAAATGLKFTEKVDPAVYGKKGKLYQKPVAGASENANYYIFDFSTPGHVDVEIGYDSGIDI
jgi:hypothetical protein